MPTMRQRRLAEAIVAASRMEVPPTKKELVESAGYSVATADSSGGRQMDQPGVKKSLEELGFTEEAAKRVVAEIMHSPKAKDRDRLTAADMSFKVHGSYAAQQVQSLNVNVEVPANSTKADRIRREYEEKLYEELSEGAEDAGTEGVREADDAGE